MNQIEEDNEGINELGEPKLEPNEFYTVGKHPFTLQTHRGDENGPVIAKMVRARVSLCSVRARTPTRMRIRMFGRYLGQDGIAARMVHTEVPNLKSEQTFQTFPPVGQINQVVIISAEQQHEDPPAEPNKEEGEDEMKTEEDKAEASP